jgi:tagatose-1,6-bisphosphate aldolase
MKNKSPLTKAELDAFKKNVLQTFDEVYSQVLASGALDESYFQQHNHIAARMAIVITAEKYAPISSYKKDFKNLRKFV